MSFEMMLFGCVGAILLVLYVLERRALARTDDVDTLCRYSQLFLFSQVAKRRLGEICEEQLEECTKSEEAKRISDLAWKYDLFELTQAADLKWNILTFNEMKSAIKEAVQDEKTLLKIRSELAHLLIARKDELVCSLMSALRPFTAKRIDTARTVEELVVLKGGEMFLNSWLSFNEALDRIDVHLKSPYEARLKKLVLKEALQANRRGEINSLCFLRTTDDHNIDALVSMKCAFLRVWVNEEMLASMNTLGRCLNKNIYMYLKRLS